MGYADYRSGDCTARYRPGVSLPADVIQTFGNQTLTAAQAVAGLFGTALAIYGRFKASSVLSRKS